jgi:EamA-like transporter family
MPSVPRPSRWLVILAFGLVYLFWGSTYLAIDIAVQTIPPALMCGLRFSIAGVVMLAVCAATGRKVFYSPRQIALAAIVGLLLLMGGNLTLSYAELAVSSGLAALIIAITPLWFLVLDQLLLGDHHISRRGKAGLALGIVGLFVLVWPQLRAGSLGRRELIASGQSHRRLLQLGARLCTFKTLAIRGGCLQRYGMANPRSRRRQLRLRALRGRYSPGRLDYTWPRSRRVPRRLRLLDRLHGLYLPARARSNVEGFYLRVRQSSCCRFSRLVDSARTRGSFHPDGKRYRRIVCHSRHQREGERESSRSGTPGSRSRR